MSIRAGRTSSSGILTTAAPTASWPRFFTNCSKSSLVTILFFLRSFSIPLLGVLLTLQIFLRFLIIGRPHSLFAAIRALVTSSFRFEGIVASVTGIDFFAHCFSSFAFLSPSSVMRMPLYHIMRPTYIKTRSSWPMPYCRRISMASSGVTRPFGKSTPFSMTI